MALTWALPGGDVGQYAGSFTHNGETVVFVDVPLEISLNGETVTGWIKVEWNITTDEIRDATPPSYTKSLRDKVKSLLW